jgi:hypothetical protein
MALSVEIDNLRASLSCCTYNGAQHTHVLIKETDALAKLKRVTLTAPAGDWFAFDPDSGRGRKQQMSPLLATGTAHDHHRACDCVVVISRAGKLTIVYIDMKSGNAKGYAGQFKSTRQFMRYALGLQQEFHGTQWPALDERFVILFGGQAPLLNKQTTVPRSFSAGPTRPDAPIKREVANGATVWLKELVE